MNDTILIGDKRVARMGFGAMRLLGPMVWGEPDDPERARAVLRRAVELGIQLIDTSWYYGPHVANRLIAEALHPYPETLLIATKLGGRRTPDKGWAPFARPEELREGCEYDLRDLRLDALDLVHFRYMPASGVPFLESLDAMIALKAEGKIRHLGLSGVGVGEIEQALARTPIVTVQNMFNAAGAGAPSTHSPVDDPETVLALCEQRGIAFLPYFPLASGKLGKAQPSLDAITRRHGASPAQIALAWLLARSPVIVPIPGTSSLTHLEDNWNARLISLAQSEVAAIAREARQQRA